MEVTEVRIFLAEEERLKAYVTVTFDNCFVVRDLKIINGNTGLFVAMPSKKKKDGSYKDIAHPINSDFRNYLEKLVLEKYRDELKMVAAGFSIKRPDDKAADGDRPANEAEAGGSSVVAYEANREYEAGIGPDVTYSKWGVGKR